MRGMSAFKEKAVGFLLVGGVVLFIAGIVLTFMFVGAGGMHGAMTREPGTDRIVDPGDMNLVPLGFLVIAAGVGMFGGGIGWAIWTHKHRHDGPMAVTPNVRVVGRYGYTHDGLMIHDEYEFEADDKPQYYVRLEVAPGRIDEYECRPETFFAAGEGMVGEAVLKGKWLGRFTPYIGMRPE